MNKVVLLLALLSARLFAQQPVFGNEIPVTISGYSLDAMEPCISPDGNALFFNSLNNGSTTSLYYAAKVNDSTFNLVGLVPVVNQTVTPRLDAVASLDTADNFYWVSTRDYPANYNNLQRVRFLQSGYTNFGRVYGDIYIYSPGWIIMDAAINYTGNKLLYCNAFFNNCQFGMPCKSALGFAQKTNDSTFSKFGNSTALLAALNDTANYIVYAPHLTEDELELYYTRAVPNIAQTEICVSVRSNTSSVFGPPAVLLPMSSSVPEGPTITTDKSKMYYHKKSGSLFKLFLRKRTGSVGLNETSTSSAAILFPNPNYGILHVEAEGDFTVKIYDSFGLLLKTTSSKTIDISGFERGIYFVNVICGQSAFNRRIVLSEP